jgi:hypothetical protein
VLTSPVDPTQWLYQCYQSTQQTSYCFEPMVRMLVVEPGWR